MRSCYTILTIWMLTGCLNVGKDTALKEDAYFIKHDLEIRHPSFPDNQTLQQQLIIHFDGNKHVIGYEMEVDSVFCLETKCEVIPVRLYWNALGEYQKFQLPEGGQLTKKDHVVFTREDYLKLDQILGDEYSLLKNLRSEQIVDPQKAIQTVDGVSAPTPVSMQSAVVSGAAYTCYTLWHWVNGEVADNILKLTTGSVPSEQLVKFYRSGKEKFVKFAVDQLIARKAFDAVTIEQIIQGIPEGEDSVKSALRYLTQASIDNESSVYFEAIDRLFPQCGKNERIYILESMATSSLDPPGGFYDNFSRNLPTLESYYEVHLLLDLETRNNPLSWEATRQAITLLDNSNFLIARRAFWFLEERELSPQQTVRVDTFRRKFHDRI